MDLQAVTLLSDRLTGDSALAAFFAARYPSLTLKRFIGYKRVPNANDFPYLSFVPVRQQKRSGEQSMLLSVVLGINEPELTSDGIFEGVRQSAIILNLMQNALTPLRLAPGLTISPEWKIINDMGMKHPFYETELALSIAIRYPLQYAANS